MDDLFDERTLEYAVEAAIERPRVSIHFRGKERRKSACDMLTDALIGSARVDFPMITEICERTRSNASELATLACHLAAVIGERSNSDLSRKLKAVTITHELLYDEKACKALVDVPGFLESLRLLQRLVKAIDGGPVAEGIYLLSSEILRQLTPSSPTCSSPLNRQCGWQNYFEDLQHRLLVALG